MSTHSDEWLFECHPELTFASLRGGDPAPPKHSPAGAVERLRLLRVVFPDLEDRVATLAIPTANLAHSLDAYAALSTALRCLRGEHEELGDGQRDSEPCPCGSCSEVGARRYRASRCASEPRPILVFVRADQTFVRADQTRLLVRLMLLNDGAAPAVVLVLLGLWLGQQGGLTQMQAEPLSPDYNAADRFQLVSASVMIPRPVDGQVPIVASGAIRPDNP